MSRPVLDTSHDFDGDVIYSEAEMEGPPAKRRWATRLLVVVLLAASVYALWRGIARHAHANDEVRQLSFLLQAPPPAADALPSADDLGGLSPMDAMTAWTVGNAQRLVAVRLHLFASYALMLLCPVGLVALVLVWWRGQFRKNGATLDKAQVVLTVTVLVLIGGARSFDAYTLMALGKVPVMADLRSFMQQTAEARKPERLALLRGRIQQADAQLRDKDLAPAARAEAAETIRTTVSRADFAEVFPVPERQTVVAAVNDLIKVVYQDEALCPPLIRALRALDKAEGDKVLAAREDGKPVWVDVKSPAGLRSLTRAVLIGDQAAVERLVSRGVDVNALTPGDGRTPLHTAVSKRNMKMARLLLDHGAKPDVAGKHDDPRVDREFPLHRAVGNPRLVQLLLTYHADPNALDVGGMTPLHRAAALGDLESADLLLKKGAQVNRIDRSKRTPRDVAYQMCSADKKEAMRDALLAHGALTGDQLLRKGTPTASLPKN
jgi:hypothetical protein